MSEGWRCPTCGKVYAPWVTECRMCPATSVASDTITIRGGDAACYHEFVSDTGGMHCIKCGAAGRVSP